MSIAVVTLGHGGGVNLGLRAGNTGFALVPDFDMNEYQEWTARYPSEVVAGLILRAHPYWLIDCGPETFAWICEQNAMGFLRGVFITHCHTDHAGGLAGLAWRLRFVDKKKVGVYCDWDMLPFLESQNLELRYLNAKQRADNGDVDWTINDFFDIYLWDCPLKKFQSDPGLPFQATFMRVDHNILDFPATSVCITYQGTTLLFSGDTARSLLYEGNGELRQLGVQHNVAKVDYVFHDVQFYLDPANGYEVHCPYSELRDSVPPEHRSKVLMAHTNNRPPDQAFADGFRWAEKFSIHCFQDPEKELTHV